MADDAPTEKGPKEFCGAASGEQEERQDGSTKPQGHKPLYEKLGLGRREPDGAPSARVLGSPTPPWLKL